MISGYPQAVVFAFFGFDKVLKAFKFSVPCDARHCWVLRL
jgi:hypothetical protein